MDVLVIFLLKLCELVRPYLVQLVSELCTLRPRLLGDACYDDCSRSCFMPCLQ